MNDVDKINQYTLNVHTVDLQLYMLYMLSFPSKIYANELFLGLENFISIKSIKTVPFPLFIALFPN
jgi:hypothetical protein